MFFPISSKKADNQIEKTQTIEQTKNIQNVDAGNIQPLGNPNAQVKIIIFGDFLCPFCAKTEIEFIPKIKYLIDQGKVVVYWRDFLIHEPAIVVHNAARCANDQNKFWEFSEKAFNLFMKGENTTQKQTLLKIAKEINLDIQSFEKCINENRHNQEVQNDTQYAFQIGVKATPTFFVNNEQIIGANFYNLMSTINKYINQ